MQGLPLQVVDRKDIHWKDIHINTSNKRVPDSNIPLSETPPALSKTNVKDLLRLIAAPHLITSDRIPIATRPLQRPCVLTGRYLSDIGAVFLLLPIRTVGFPPHIVE